MTGRKKKIMKRPETLSAVTVKQHREQYRKNKESLSCILNSVLAGVSAPPDLESALNFVMSAFVEENDYVREREQANYGWDKNFVDFSQCEF